jgi:glycosyltransferase involved in cell wall biosynthesis
VVASGPSAIVRVAFLTPEFVTESSGSGGIGSYVLKMATALAVHGVTAEVFVPSTQSGVVHHDGIRVERVPRERSLVLRGLTRVLRPWAGSQSRLLLHLLNARRLARALERRHAECAFDVVQSSNHRLTGSFVRRDRGRRHMIRISTSRVLYDRAVGLRHGALSRLNERLDVRALRRADVAYAPSRFMADYFNATYGTDVRVLRPPAELGATPAERHALEVPERYLVHFGSLGDRKGTGTVARALELAWQVDPTLRMVWAGRLADDEHAAFRRAWGDRSDRVLTLGPLDKPTLYRVVADAVAAVLPSTVDNLPNTVIESLTLGVPVIGSDGASIDELVEEGRSGTLVPIGDVRALATAMLDAWQGRSPFLGSAFRSPESLLEMQPNEAVRRFLALATAPAVRDDSEATSPSPGSVG